MTVDEVIHKNERDLRETIEHLEASNRMLDRQIRSYQRDRGQQKEFVREMVDAIKARTPYKKVPWSVPALSKKPVHAVLHLTDWHIGERISKNETEGFGRFNWQIAQDHVEYLIKAFLRWVETQRNGYRIDDLTVIATGDWVAGAIHEELLATQEFPVTVQTEKAGWLLGEAIAQLAPHFERITIREVGGDNHGRLTKKPQFKQKAQNNFGYLVYALANQELSRHSNITIERAEGIKLRFKIGDYWFLGMHGDTVKGWMGIPYYGLERDKAREAVRRMFKSRGFHYQINGHFHQFAWNSGSILIGGSLSGTNEFDHGCGRHAPPAQTAFLVGAHGVFNFVPFSIG